MAGSVVQELRNQIRGVSGALLVVGITFHYTMETWWLGWTLPFSHLIGYALVGLAMITVVTRNVGFRAEEQNRRSEPWWSVATDFAQILLQSFVASYLILLLIGIVDVGSSLDLVVRLGLIEVVPLGFGAAMANDLLGSTGEEATAADEARFPRNLGIFTIGALFVTATIAPTQEMELISAHMGWPRHFMLIAVTLVLVYLVLYELEFKGHEARIQQGKRVQVATVFVVYALGVTVSFFLLLGYGHFVHATVALMYQETIVLAFPASLGAAGAEVVI